LEKEFEKNSISCLDMVVQQVQTQEQTQELRIPEGMPPVGTVLGAWGQCILRSKQWQTGSATAAVGLMVKVAYLAEGDRKVWCLESWIPFSFTWDLPETDREGALRVLCRTRFVDARAVSPEKLMIRAGVSALAQGAVTKESAVFAPTAAEDDIQLLQREYLLRLPVEMGEKTFSLEEELTLPPSVPVPRRILYSALDCAGADRKVLGEKLVFRGSGKLHLVYEGEDGQVSAWDFELPFSQFAQLEGSFSQDAQADLWYTVTALETELDSEGKLHMKGAAAAQYLVEDRKKLLLTQDAYSNLRQVNLHRAGLKLPAVLENRQETATLRENLTVDADVVADAVVLTDFPRVQRSGDEVQLELQGMCRLLCYGPEGALTGHTHRFRWERTIPAHEEALLLAVPATEGAHQFQPASGQITAQLQIPMDLTVTAGQGMDMVTGLEAGELRQPDPARPSLVLTRANGRDLWALARESGSTVEAIRTANGLEGEPEPGRMLLIPVL